MGPVAFAVYSQILQSEVYPVYQDAFWEEWLGLTYRQAFLNNRKPVIRLAYSKGENRVVQ